MKQTRKAIPITAALIFLTAGFTQTIHAEDQRAVTLVDKPAAPPDQQGQTGSTGDSLRDIAIQYKDAMSFYLLGQKHASGRGTVQSYPEALKWYKEAAKLGHTKSEYQIGRIYFRGLGTDVDYDQAALWLLNPANKGFTSAQYMLGKIYLTGTPGLIKKDPQQAFIWLKKAADDYHREACWNVGNMYYLGMGVPGNLDMAEKYLLLAKEQGNHKAAGLLAKIQQEDLSPAVDVTGTTGKPAVVELKSVHSRTVLASTTDDSGKIKQPALTILPIKAAVTVTHDDFGSGDDTFTGLRPGPKRPVISIPATTTEPENSQSQATNNTGTKPVNPTKTLSPKDALLAAASNGDTQAQFKAGQMYLEGKNGFPKNDLYALRWLKAAASQNNAEAQFQTGMFYYKPGQHRNHAAQHWLQQAADNGHVDAQYFLGSIFNTRQQIDLAVKWLDTAFRNKHEKALDLLIELYSSGRLKKPDSKRVVAWLEQASLSGRGNAQYELGKHYLSQKELADNVNKALTWIEKAARNGYLPAKFKLGMMYQQGIGEGKQYAKSAHWFREAADEGLPEAQYQLAELYRQGFGLPRSDSKAREWYSAAAEQGYEKAQLRLETGNENPDKSD